MKIQGKSLKRILSILLMVCMIMTMLIGCGGGEKKDDGKADTKNGKIVITDALGREVTFENGPVKKAVCTNPGALRLYTYVCGTDGIVGVTERSKPGEGGKERTVRRMPFAIANPDLMDLPSIGEGGKDGGDFEKILEAEPDVIFDMGMDKAAVENMQSKLEIPVVAIDGGPGVVFDAELYESLENIGKVMGKDKRAKEVVEFMEDCKKDLNDRTKDIPDDKKLSAYAGGLAWSGPHGIESTRENYPLFEAVNAKNVVTGVDKDGSVMIDKEKLLEWDPDVIFLDLASLFLVQEDFRKEPDFYKGLKAFKEDHVYAQLPYVWCWVNPDTAMADAYYIGKVLYPDQFEDVNPEEKAGDIYKFLVGKDVYEEMASENGGFRKITIDDLQNMEVNK